VRADLEAAMRATTGTMPRNMRRCPLAADVKLPDGVR